MSRRIGLCGLVAVVAIAVAGSVAPTAHAERGQKLRAPGLLWKSYPLEPRPKKSALARRQSRKASRKTLSPRQAESSTLLLVTVLLSTVLAAGAAAVVWGTPIPAGVMRLPRRPRGPPPADTHAQLLETLRQKLRPTPPEPPPDPLPEGHETQLVERILRATASHLSEPSPEPVVEAHPETSERRAVEQPGTPVPEPKTDTRPALPPEPVVVEQLRPSPPKAEPRPEPLSEPVVEQKEPSPQSRERAPARRRAPAKANVVRCEIRLWRGFVKFQLFAVMAGSEGAFAVSPYFRLREDDTPTPQAEHALAALLANLERAGWTVASSGPTWYRHRLERFD
jgi:hypothetical protein